MKSPSSILGLDASAGSPKGRGLAFGLLLLAMQLGASHTAMAQPSPEKVNVNLFQPALDAGGGAYVTQHGAKVPAHLHYGFGLFFHYGRNPFVLAEVGPGGNLTDDRVAVVRDLLAADLSAWVGLWGRLSLGLSMPLGLYMVGTTLTAAGEPAPDGDLGAFAWGDPALHAKVHIWGKPLGFAVGAHLAITAPLGRLAEGFVGERSATLQPRVIAEYVHPVVQASVNLGAVFRPKQARFFDSFEQGQQLTYGAALAVRPMAKVPLRILVELFGRTDFTAGVDRNPLEAGGALAYRLPRGVDLLAGANAGLVGGIGTPDFRAFLGVRFTPRLPDRDGDGIPDELDRCPDLPEDKDGFQDEDGCPDPDNDGDGIPDEADKCPKEPEDKDGFQDEDGCPDLDNDGDGIPDKEDNCPLVKGPAATKGCPDHMLDADEDGVQDSLDKCPNEPEDRDGFQDEDGCPDPDNDGDGILDEADKCPNEPEDKDGFQDEDGCPDPDDDNDGVCDDNPTIQKNLHKFRDRCIGRDLCPGKPETINGVEDEDGCPDKGPSALIIDLKPGTESRGTIQFSKNQVQFVGESTRVVPDARPALTQLAHQLRATPALRKVAIVVHTDLRTPGEYALRITQAQAQAIVTFLKEVGIDPKRLEAVGAGQSKLLCQAKTKACHATNRRVEVLLKEVTAP